MCLRWGVDILPFPPALDRRIEQGEIVTAQVCDGDKTNNYEGEKHKKWHVKVWFELVVSNEKPKRHDRKQPQQKIKTIFPFQYSDDEAVFSHAFWQGKILPS